MKIYIEFDEFGEGSNCLNQLKEKFELVINTSGKRPDKIELKKISEEFDGMIIGGQEVVDKEILENSKLKFIGVLAGNELIDLEECEKRGIYVFNIIGSNAGSVAEHVFLLMLVLCKKLIDMDKTVRAEQFDKLRTEGTDLKNKTLGLIGAGHISKEIIKRAKAFEMNIICWTPHPEKHGDLDISFVDLNKLFTTSDFVSINIRSSPKTLNLVGEKELSLMKPSAFLINTSRGEIVDEEALVYALKKRVISGAGIDVFKEEPTHNKGLFELNNVILTPHVAGVTKDALINMHKKLTKDILNFIK